MVGEVGVDIAAMVCGCGFTVQSICESAHTSFSLAKLAEPMKMCVEVFLRRCSEIVRAALAAE